MVGKVSPEPALYLSTDLSEPEEREKNFIFVCLNNRVMRTNEMGKGLGKQNNPGNVILISSRNTFNPLQKLKLLSTKQ